jgi:rhodanese-related sulfurtransferase
MPHEIDRDQVRRLLDEGAQLVDVMPSAEYQEAHLPGALNLPLRKIERDVQAVLRSATACDRVLLRSCLRPQPRVRRWALSLVARPMIPKTRSVTQLAR